MYATCLCVFLAGFHYIQSKRSRPIINGIHLPENVSRQWERLGRMLTLGGFGGFAAYVDDRRTGGRVRQLLGNEQ